MKNFIFAMLISIAFQVHAGDLIFLDNYRLEKSESSNLVPEREQEQVRERREVNADTQVKVHERRNINYTIKQIKNKREIDDTNEDSSLLEYQF
jgi:hypothetical protein